MNKIESFKELSIDPAEFAVIQSQLIPFILQKYPMCVNFWNHVELAELENSVPKLLDVIEQHVGQRPLRSYLLAIPDADPEKLRKKLGKNSLHKDTSVEEFRLNWPILNSGSIETRFYTSVAEPSKLLLPTGETYLTYKESDCELIDTLVMKRPTVIRVHTIHGLYHNGGDLPRYVLSFNFAKELLCSH
jgi:hypothetical protein